MQENRKKEEQKNTDLSQKKEEQVIWNCYIADRWFSNKFLCGR